jgi:hypothetical protein
MNDLSTDVEHLAARLQPLFKGTPVVLQAHIATVFGRSKNPIITFTPGSLYGWPKERILVSVISMGSCIIHLESKREMRKREKQGLPFKPRIADLVRAGIPAKLATALMQTLQHLYSLPQEKHHASTTSRTTSSSRRSSSTRPRRYTPFREGGSTSTPQ